MKSYYEIEIANNQNGYVVSCQYKTSVDTEAKNYDRYRYEIDKFVFTSWDQIVEFITTNKMSVPPTV